MREPGQRPGPAAADAVLVARLREAGAEVFATSQCLEYAAGFAHPQVGDTRNPRDPPVPRAGPPAGRRRWSRRACALALGTDTGGSIRIPAAYCGIAGLKPTYGLLPVAGVFPLSPACDHVGTLTATVAGAADLLAAPPRRPPAALRAARPGGDGRFTVGVLAAQLTDPSVTPQVRRAVTGAGRAGGGWLAAAGDRRPLAGGAAEWEDALAVIVAGEAAAVHQRPGHRRVRRGHPGPARYGASVTSEQNDAAIRQRAELSAAIEASLSGVDVLASLTVGYQAPEQDPLFGAGDGLGGVPLHRPVQPHRPPGGVHPGPGAGLPRPATGPPPREPTWPAAGGRGGRAAFRGRARAATVSQRED